MLEHSFFWKSKSLLFTKEMLDWITLYFENVRLGQNLNNKLE